LVADATLDLSLGHWLPFLPAIQAATGRTTASLALSSGPLNMAQIEEMGLPGLMAALTGSAEIAWSGATLWAVACVLAMTHTVRKRRKNR
jgi:hypothetical protein